MIKYIFREPLTIKAGDQANPQKIGEALAKLAELANGELKPKIVVEAARSTQSVLHKHFEWDDRIAAEAHRLSQARDIIQCIRVEDEEAAQGHAPAFISIADKSGTSYRTINEVKNSEHLQGIILESAERELLAFEKRYRDLNDICAKVKEARMLVTNKIRRNESRA